MLNWKLRVWWIPQLPMDCPFYVSVETVREGRMILEVLADYDIFQFENNIKPDYSNTGGLEHFDPDDTEDGPEGSWVEWCDEDGYTLEDSPEGL